jgi:hypothetical protein
MSCLTVYLFLWDLLLYFLYPYKGGKNGLFSRRNWKKRFFRLFPAFLKVCYYSDASSDSKKYLLGEITLSYSTKVEIAPMRERKSASSKFEFLLVTEGRELHLAARDERERDYWVKTFNAIVSHQVYIRECQATINNILSHETEISSNAERADCTLAHGTGLYTAVVGEENYVTLVTNDVFGNIIYNDDVSFTCSLSNHEMHYDLVYKNNSDGTYAIAYSVSSVGEFSLQVLQDGFHIPGSPFSVTAASIKANASKTFAIGGSLQICQFGKVETFSVKT